MKYYEEIQQEVDAKADISTSSVFTERGTKRKAAKELDDVDKKSIEVLAKDEDESDLVGKRIALFHRNLVQKNKKEARKFVIKIEEIMLDYESS